MDYRRKNSSSFHPAPLGAISPWCGIHKVGLILDKKPIFTILRNKYFLNKMVREVNQSIKKPKPTSAKALVGIGEKRF
ncbi:hypothetical protein KJ840_05380 [Patescibacteria group bacterium]|nr:hypothetical protein [Patescibacteria group bacterium]